jgi:uncharacterized protein
VVTAALLSSLLAGCTGSQPSPAPATGSPQTTPAAPETPSPSPAPNPVSLEALMEGEFVGENLQLGKTLSRTSTYTTRAVTYDVADFTISGIINIPRGDGPFPALVLGHGYIDPAIYTTGRGLKREQDYLARNGFIVLHTDYRNHASSDDDPKNDVRLRLGYIEDVIGAALALKSSSLPLDTNRIGYLGRSMGGGIGYQAMVTAPGVFGAYVLYAPTSASAADNFNRWGRRAPELAARVITAYGAPEDAPKFWAGMSAINFFERVTEPVLIHHGKLDDTCPIEWSERAVSALNVAEKQVRLDIYPSEGHTFYSEWSKSMQRTVAFLRENL